MGPDLRPFGKDGNKNGCRFPDPKTEQLFEKMVAKEKMFCAFNQVLLHSLMSTSHSQARPQTLSDPPLVKPKFGASRWPSFPAQGHELVGVRLDLCKQRKRPVGPKCSSEENKCVL